MILGVESSCDETALALVEGGRTVRISLVASQTAAHLPFGGVVPEVAAREHLRVIAPMLDEIWREIWRHPTEPDPLRIGFSRVSPDLTPDLIEAVAVTQGPGLIGALLVGVAYAKGLALALGKPLVPVDHVHAHVHGALLGVDATDAEIYPTLALVVSGGHTNLYRLTSPTAFQLLGSSVDDACGECFDKVAKLLGLGYPGGPAIEKLARGGDPRAVPMPRMVSEKKRIEFSYSGLKTYVANNIAQNRENLPNLCAAFQDEALGQIVRKLGEGLRRHPDTKSVLVAGGVAANQRFRALMAEMVPVKAYFPAPAYCSDNAAMIAAYGHHVLAAGRAAGRDFAPSVNWDAYSRYDYAGVTG